MPETPIGPRVTLSQFRITSDTISPIASVAMESSGRGAGTTGRRGPCRATPLNRPRPTDGEADRHAEGERQQGRGVAADCQQRSMPQGRLSPTVSGNQGEAEPEQRVEPGVDQRLHDIGGGNTSGTSAASTPAVPSRALWRDADRLAGCDEGAGDRLGRGLPLWRWRTRPFGPQAPAR